MSTAIRPDGIGAPPPQTMQTVQTEGSLLDQSFIADRAIFWGRFTGFIKLGIGAVILILLFLLFVVYL